MLELNQLADAIVSSFPKGEDSFVVDRKTTGKDLSVLPPNLKAEVEELRSAIGKIVPDDVGFSLSFSDHQVALSLDYDDGNTGTFGGAMYFTKRKYLLSNLRRTDWDEFRGDSLKATSFFDELLNDAEDRPANIPSSEEAAERYAHQLARVMEEVKRDSPTMPFVLFVGVADVNDVGARELNTRDQLLGDIADELTFQNDILAVWEDGVPWSFPKLEATKLEAVEGLGPISRAKAETPVWPVKET